MMAISSLITQRWRARLKGSGPAPIVGLSWRGGTPRTRGALHSLRLDELDVLLGRERVAFVILQRGLTDDERAQVASRSNVLIPESVADLDDLAALVRALDLVISVPSTMTQLAGALGRPLWVLLSASPEWRYLWRGERMPWYPTATLLRQPRMGEWDTVVRETVGKLQQWKG